MIIIRVIRYACEYCREPPQHFATIDEATAHERQCVAERQARREGERLAKCYPEVDP